jgi:hypothetical protein
MSGGGDADARVWDEFFDKVSGTLRLDELEVEFTRLWGHEAAAGADPELQNAALTEAARALEHQTLLDLMLRYEKEINSRPKRPRANAATGRVFERSALVVAIARLRADHHCEVPGCQHPVFVCADGMQYCEVHHIVPLAEGGEDLLSNVACLCPSHHREVHVGSNARGITGALKTIRLKNSWEGPQQISAQSASPTTGPSTA